MFRRYSRTIATVVLGFFTWTSGGVFSIAHAAQDAVKKDKAVEVAKKQTEGPEERFAKLTEELEEALADPKADVDKKRQRLKAGKAEMEALDADIRKQFAETEKKLKDAKLPDAILQRHYKFVKHYDDNLAELKANIDQIDKAKDQAEAENTIEKARKHLEKVKAPSRHQKLDPNNLPHRQPKVIKHEPRMKKEEFERDLKKDKHAWKSAKRIQVASAGSLAGLLVSSSINAVAPTADDLAETVEVQLTPEIQAKALELGNNPVKIYEWVRNNFKYEPYYGSLKGAQQTLLEMSGNDYDLASLLIALLRAANIPTRYASGTIELPIERTMSWLGVKDATVAVEILASGGIPVKAGMSGGKITSVRLEHVWVEAFVNMYPSFGAKPGPGNAWVPLDSSFKEQELNTSVDISKLVAFNESDYLRTQNKLPPSLTYLNALTDYHAANYQGGMHEMFYLKKIKTQEFGILLGTLPYRTVVAGSAFSSIGTSPRHVISIGLSDPATGEAASVAKNVCELTGKQITVSYAPATDQDNAVMANYGGLLKTPAYLVKVMGQVKVDGVVVLEGPPVNMGESLKLSLQFTSPGTFSGAIETEMAAGIYYNIALSAMNVADKQASNGLDISNNLPGTFFNSINDGDNQVGKVLHNIGLQYFTHTNNASKLLEGVMHIYNTRAVNAGFVSVSAKYRTFFGITVSPPIISGLNIDIPRYVQSPFSITGDKEQEKAFTKLQGLTTSYFEHAIWESFSGIDSVSTVKLLQLANEAGLPIYTINSANIDTTLPLLIQSQQVKDDIRNVVGAGKEVTIPKNYITRNEWTGTGYMVRNPDTGEGAYMISSGLAGGGSTSSPASSALGLRAHRYAAIVIGQINRAALGTSPWDDIGDYEAWGYDLWIACNIADMLLSKGYIPRIVEVKSKKEFLSVVNKLGNDNKPENEIIYYSGHGLGRGTSKNPNPNYVQDELVPSYKWELDFLGNLNVAAEYVSAAEIHANARIVFLNSCNSMYKESFREAFGADNSLVMGWDNSLSYWDASDFADDWWRAFIDGKSAKDAADQIKDKYYTTSDPNNPDKATLKFKGEGTYF
jgi:transglutaminase superfamily protein